MDLTVALTNVVTDIRASYPHLSTPLAIQHARNTTSVAGLNEDDPTAPAYRLVLQASVAELALAIAGRDGLTLDHGDVHEDASGVTIDGMDAFEWLDAVFYAG